jgi:hypothetical protein
MRAARTPPARAPRTAAGPPAVATPLRGEDAPAPEERRRSPRVTNTERVQIGSLFDGTILYQDDVRTLVVTEADYVAWSKIYFFDAGFGSVILAHEMAKRGIHCVCVVKQAYAGFPHVWLTAKMMDEPMPSGKKGMPSGTWITLTTTMPDGIELVCIGYKYNRKKCLFFVHTMGAGASTAGAPYKATFPDAYGNVMSRLVARPAVISRHFMFSDGIDIHNHIRQHVLALEEAWVTSNSWFRLMSTILGITVTDAFLAHRAQLRASHEDKDMSVLDFADTLAMQLLELGGEDFLGNKRRRFEDLDGSQLDGRAPTTTGGAAVHADPTSEHVLDHINRTKMANGKYTYQQRKCTVCPCYDAAFYCVKCGPGHFLCGSAKKGCLAVHIQRATAPAASSSSSARRATFS